MPKRVVLAYSGGLDTSVAVRWMIEELGVEVVAVACDVGQDGDWEGLAARAVAAGAIDAVVVDCREEFARDFVGPALRPTPCTRTATPWCRPCRGRSSCGTWSTWPGASRPTRWPRLHRQGQ